MGGLRLGGAGETREWAVIMRRLPAAGMLDRLLLAGGAPDDLAQRLADRLIPFFAAAPRCAADGGDAATAVLRDNLRGIGPYVGGPVFAGEFRQIERVVAAFLEDGDALLRARVAAGWQREGHGDLRCEHVCLEPGGVTQVYDCVEFSHDIRCADVASDLAFLLADLRRLGAARVADALVARCRAAGLDLPPEQLALYETHRALVRVKVAAISASESGLSAAERADFRGQAASWLHGAARSALQVAPCLLAMTGLSGSGKSTAAADIAAATGARLLASDVVRLETMGGATDRYAPEARLEIYARLLERARPLLAAGQVVLLDAAFLRGVERDAVGRLAHDAGVPLLFIEATCAPEVAEARVTARAARGQSVSDADLTVLRAQRAALIADPPPLPPGASQLHLQTDCDAPWSLDPLWAWLGGNDLLLPAFWSPWPPVGAAHGPGA